jgi:hypothetical protein
VAAGVQVMNTPVVDVRAKIPSSVKPVPAGMTTAYKSAWLPTALIGVTETCALWAVAAFCIVASSELNSVWIMETSEFATSKVTPETGLVYSQEMPVPRGKLVGVNTGFGSVRPNADPTVAALGQVTKADAEADGVVDEVGGDEVGGDEAAADVLAPGDAPHAATITAANATAVITSSPPPLGMRQV